MANIADSFVNRVDRAMAALDAQRVRENLPNEIAIASTANEVCKRLDKIFSKFMASLKPDEEIGIVLSAFGSVRQISVHYVTAVGPNLLLIDGYEDGCPVSLVQHISQLSFLLVPVKIDVSAGEPVRKIGFQAG